MLILLLSPLWWLAALGFGAGIVVEAIRRNRIDPLVLFCFLVSLLMALRVCP